MGLRQANSQGPLACSAHMAPHGITGLIDWKPPHWASHTGRRLTTETAAWAEGARSQQPAPRKEHRAAIGRSQVHQVQGASNNTTYSHCRCNCRCYSYTSQHSSLSAQDGRQPFPHVEIFCTMFQTQKIQRQTLEISSQVRLPRRGEVPSWGCVASPS